jgi:hypothetical protein
MNPDCTCLARDNKAPGASRAKKADSLGSKEASRSSKNKSIVQLFQ